MDPLDELGTTDIDSMMYMMPFLLGFALFAIVAGLITYVLQALFLSSMFKKANFEPTWGPWVPIYNSYLTLKFGGQNPLWFWIYLGTSVLAAIPTVGPILSMVGSILFLIVSIYAYININKSFGKESDLALWTLFAVFLPLIWMGVLAYSSAKWKPASGPVFLEGVGSGGSVKTI